MQGALRDAGLELDWAVFFLETPGATEAGGAGHRCTLTVGRRGASTRLVEALESGEDAAIRRVVERIVSVLGRPRAPASLAEVVPLPRSYLAARSAAVRTGADEEGPTARAARGG